MPVGVQVFIRRLRCMLAVTSMRLDRGLTFCARGIEGTRWTIEWLLVSAGFCWDFNVIEMANVLRQGRRHRWDDNDCGQRRLGLEFRAGGKVQAL